MIEEVLTEVTHERTAELGGRLEDGIRRIISRLELPLVDAAVVQSSWHWWTPTPPGNATGQRAGEAVELSDAIRLLLLENGIFEAGGWSNPTVGATHSAADIEAYLVAPEEVIGLLVAD